MQTVVETPTYLARAKAEGLTEEEMKFAVDFISANPAAGDMIVGSGGCRKIRVPGKGRGKSGGYRIVTLFGGGHMPVFMLTVLSKGSRANFSTAEVSAMRKVAKQVVDAYRPRASSQG